MAESAQVELTKDEVNVVLDALDVLMSAYQSISTGTGTDGLGRDVTVVVPQVEVAAAVWNKVFSAGSDAGWTPAGPAPPPSDDTTD